MGKQCPLCHTILDEDGRHRCNVCNDPSHDQLRSQLLASQAALEAAYASHEARTMTPSFDKGMTGTDIGALAGLRAIAGHGDNTSYPSRVAASQVRSAIRDFLALFDAKPSQGRNTVVAAVRVAAMDDDEVKLFAERDPDIFRDVARALSSLASGRETSKP